MKSEGNWIKAAAAQAGLSLTELANQLGLSRATLYAYVAGALIPSNERLKEISEITKFPLDISGAHPSESSQVSSKGQLAELAQAMLKGADPLAVVALVEKSPQSQNGLSGDLLLQLGNSLTLLGFYQDATYWCRKAKEAFEEAKNSHGAGRCCQTLGFCFTNTGPLSRAKDYFEEATRLLEPSSKWKPLVAKAAIYDRLGQYDASSKLIDEVLSSEKDPAARLYAKGVKASILAHLSKWDEALELETEAFEDAVKMQSNDQMCERLIMMLTTGVRAKSSRVPEILATSKGFFLAYHDQARQAMYEATLSLEALSRDDLSAAQSFAEKAIETSIKGAFRRAELAATLRLAEVAMLRGDLDVCFAYAHRAIAHAEVNEYATSQCYARMLAAFVQLCRGDIEAADQQYQKVKNFEALQATELVQNLTKLYLECEVERQTDIVKVARSLQQMGVIAKQ